MILLVVLGVGAWLLFGGENPILGTIFGPHEKVPPVQFRLKKVEAASTTHKKGRDLQKEADAVGERVRVVMDELYFDAYVNPKTWEDADYDDVWDLFDGGAASSAKGDVAILTLGENTDGYDSIAPKRSTLAVTVLTDLDNNPTTVLAIVRFTALAKHDNGTYTAISSSGSFFLHKADADWRIYSYRVNREEKKAKAPRSPSPSGAPSGEAS